MSLSLRSINYGGSCDIRPLPGQPALEVDGLEYRYPGAEKDALEGVDFRVLPGERVALVGPNGAGKSTLLHLVLGMTRARAGTVKVFGNSPRQCRHRAALVPQRSSVDWRFPITVRQAVTMGRYVHLGWFKQPGPRDREKVDQALEMMKMTDLAHRQIGELSGGQQQRMMLARTLAHDADLLLLDEPLNHVDLTTQELIFHTLEELTARGKAVLVSTHDLGVLTVHFTRALFLDRKIIADGPVEEVITPDTIARAYGFQFHQHYQPPRPADRRNCGEEDHD